VEGVEGKHRHPDQDHGFKADARVDRVQGSSEVDEDQGGDWPVQARRAGKAASEGQQDQVGDDQAREQPCLEESIPVDDKRDVRLLE
jgi:hypothetical protein